MTERRETGRGRANPQSRPQPITKKAKPSEASWEDGERIAKFLAHAGVSSRRDAEAMIEAGLVSVNGKRLDSPAFKVTRRDVVKVRGEITRDACVLP